MRLQINDSRLKRIALVAIGCMVCLTGSTASGEDYLTSQSTTTGSRQTTARAKPASTDFRVTIKIFEEKAETPVAEHLVLFQDAMIYDFDQVNPNSVTVIDSGRKRIVLLDRSTKKRAQINTDDLISIAARIRASTADPKIQDRLGMNAQVSYDQETRKYTIEFDRTRYLASVQQPTQVNITRQFAQFADWASRLNIARKRGMPPFARMEMNQRIAADGVIPDTLNLELKSGFKTKRFRSTHELIETLSEADRRRIDEVGGMIALYQEVTLSEIP